MRRSSSTRVAWERLRARRKFGTAIAASKAMIATTIMISTRVKPPRFLFSFLSISVLLVRLFVVWLCDFSLPTCKSRTDANCNESRDKTEHGGGLPRPAGFCARAFRAAPRPRALLALRVFPPRERGHEVLQRLGAPPHERNVRLPRLLRPAGLRLFPRGYLLRRGL